MIEIRRTGIDVLSNVWALEVYGDPSVSPGFDIGVGSIARQWDSTVPGAMWAKTGTDATAWTAVFFGANRALAVTDLPDTTAVTAAAALGALADPFSAPPALTTPDDFRFALKNGIAGL